MKNSRKTKRKTEGNYEVEQDNQTDGLTIRSTRREAWIRKPKQRTESQK